MQVILLKEYKETNRVGDVILYLPAGYTFSAVRFSYVPEHITKNWSIWEKSEIKAQRIFILQYKSKWILIDKKDCEIPVSIGWQYNI